MTKQDIHPIPWTISYNNDVGPMDEGFWEWWTVLDANRDEVARCDSEETAKFIINLSLNQKTP